MGSWEPPSKESNTESTKKITKRRGTEDSEKKIVWKEELNASCLDTWSGFGILLKQEEEEAFYGREEEEHCDGERRAPREPVPVGAIDHGDGGICRVVNNGDRPADAFTGGYEFVLLKTGEDARGFKFDNWQIYVAPGRARRNAVAIGVEHSFLEADDFALGASALEEQMHVGLSGGVSEARQNHGDKQLREEGITKNLFAVGKQPRDLVLGKGQGHLSGRLAKRKTAQTE